MSTLRQWLACTMLLCIFGNSSYLLSETVFKLDTFVFPTIPGNAVVGDGYGQAVHIKGKFAFVAAPDAEPNGVLRTGAIYIYRRHNGKWKNTQIITTVGVFDNLGLLRIDSAGDWLFISAIGTPIGPITIDTPLTQDFRGAVLVYKLNHKNKWEFRQIIDHKTKGLGNLTFISPAAFNPNIPFTDNQQGAEFGLNLSFDHKHELLLASAPFKGAHNEQGNAIINDGTVYAFKLNKHKTKWEFFQRIHSPDGRSANNTFGYNVRTKNKLAVISSTCLFPGSKTTNGAVYLYKFEDDKWHFVEKVTGRQKGPTATTLPVIGATLAGDAFGSALAMDGKWVVVGAGQESQSASKILRGAVYFYHIVKKDGEPHLQLKRRVFSDDPDSYMSASFFVDIKGHTALVDDPARTGPAGARQGGVRVYKFTRGTWRHVQTLYNPNGTPLSFFGTGLSLDSDFAIVGQSPLTGFFYNNLVNIPPLAADPPLGTGQALIFKRKD